MTEEEIRIKMQGFECPAYLRETCYRPIYEQAVLAIRLQKKLNRIERFCNAEEGEPTAFLPSWEQGFIGGKDYMAYEIRKILEQED